MRFRPMFALWLCLLAACIPPLQAEQPVPKAFTPSPSTKPLPKPGPHDWLAQHRERGQTFKQFKIGIHNKPSKKRGTIYLQPVGNFSGPRAVELELLREFTSTFFELPVVVRKPLSDAEFPSRKHKVFGRQLHSEKALAILKKHLPDDAYCMLAVTLVDLYPAPSWNFVFGQASLHARVGIFSFARYSPKKGTLSEEELRMLKLRAFKVLAHEAGHMFGIHHCTAHHCGMNGSNNLDETDRAPLHYCPVCLRKLHDSVGFDVAKRDLRLAGVLDKAGLKGEATWYRDRRAWLVSK